MDISFPPVTNVADCLGLDEAEVLCGFMDGALGLPLDHACLTAAYFHGWREGIVAAGLSEPDEAHKQLASAFARLRPDEG